VSPEERIKVRITYDPEVNAAYIALGTDPQRSTVWESVSLEDLGSQSDAFHAITLDLNRRGQLMGIEVLRADQFLPGDVLAKAERPGPSAAAQG
jgi:uncharacterized protein YuzE